MYLTLLLLSVLYSNIQAMDTTDKAIDKISMHSLENAMHNLDSFWENVTIDDDANNDKDDMLARKCELEFEGGGKLDFLQLGEQLESISMHVPPVKRNKFTVVSTLKGSNQKKFPLHEDKQKIVSKISLTSSLWNSSEYQALSLQASELSDFIQEIENQTSSIMYDETFETNRIVAFQYLHKLDDNVLSAIDEFANRTTRGIVSACISRGEPHKRLLKLLWTIKFIRKCQYYMARTMMNYFFGKLHVYCM